MSRRRRLRPPLPSPPARPGLGPVRAAPGCSKGPVRRRADRKEARQEGELPLRVCARVCVPGVCVRVCACACLCAPAALPAANTAAAAAAARPPLSRAPSGSPSPSSKRPLSSPSQAGPGFINMLIAASGRGEPCQSDPSERAASGDVRAPRGGRAVRDRQRSGLCIHMTQLSKKETKAETPERAGEGEG